MFNALNAVKKLKLVDIRLSGLFPLSEMFLIQSLTVEV